MKPLRPKVRHSTSDWNNLGMSGEIAGRKRWAKKVNVSKPLIVISFYNAIKVITYESYKINLNLELKLNCLTRQTKFGLT